MSRKISLPAVAEPVPLSSSVLLGPQWLDVLPSMSVSVLAEVPELQYFYATGEFWPGVSGIVPGTSCQSTTRNTMQAPMPMLF